MKTIAVIIYVSDELSSAAAAATAIAAATAVTAVAAAETCWRERAVTRTVGNPGESDVVPIFALNAIRFN